MPAASKAKVLETPKAKAQGGEVDYKAKIDAAMEAFTSKVTRGPVPLHPAPCTLHQLPVALTPLGCWSQVNKQGEEMGHKCKVRSPRPSHAGTLPTPHQVCE